MTMAEQLIQQGLQQGEYIILLRQLERKFKTIPSIYRQKLEQANTDTLLTWSDRILDSESLEEVFSS